MLLRIVVVAVCVVAMSGHLGYGQTSEEANVKAVVLQVFKGMEMGDSAMVSRSFTKEVTLTTIRRDKANNPLLHRENSLNGFLKAVGSPHPDSWFEESWNYKIEIDEDFAQVWCDYAFYLGNKFSHCGVDAFQLRKSVDGWKIFHLADTRRSTNCVIPKDVQRKHTP